MTRDIISKYGEWWLPASERLGLRWFVDSPRGERPEVVDAAMNHVVDPDKMIALDVGAHVGTWTIELAKHFRHTHAFEPLMPTWIALVHNMQERGIPHQRVTAWMTGVGDTLSNCRPHGMMNATMSSYIDPTDTGVIPVIALDDINWGKVGLVKIDVEGMEYHVIKGAQRLLETHHPVLVIEWKPDRLNRHGDFEAKIEAILNRYGYKLAEQLEIDRIYV